MKRLLCLWHGHRPGSPFLTCERCRRALSYDEWVFAPLSDRLADWWHHKTRFFRRCPDCGQRWGRHDDNGQHLPF